MATEYLDKAGLKRLIELLKAEMDSRTEQLRYEFSLGGGGSSEGGTGGGNGLTLGETAYTAYPGDKGKANAEAIEELQEAKQDKLKAGANITISQDGTISASGGGGGILEESDPTVPDWAKQSRKPTYAYSEITGKPTLGLLAERDSIAYDEIDGAPTPLQLGETSTKAYPGNKGKANADAIAELQENKQDALSFDGTYNSISNKVATVKTVTDKIAEVVAGAPDDLNTLEEIAAWIAKHPDSVAAINAAIQENADAIAELLEAKAGTEYVDEVLAEAKEYTDNKAVDSVGASVDENNVLTVAIKDKAGKVIATTTVALPSGGGGVSEEALAEYVKKTDYATSDVGGVIKVHTGGNTGKTFYSNGDGDLMLGNGEYYISLRSGDNAIRNKDLDFAIVDGLANNKRTLTPEQQTKIKAWLSITESGGSRIDTDYESSSKTLTPEANTEYYYGTLSSLGLSFGQGTTAGDMFYISFTSGETATTLTVNGTNAVFKEFVPDANSVVEICGKWNGSKWVVLFMQTAVA